MHRWPALLLLAALLLSPTGAAFRATTKDLSIAYDDAATPVIVAAGELAVSGVLTGGAFVGGATATRLELVPRIVIRELDGERIDRTTLDMVTVEIAEGGAHFSFTGGALQMDAGAPYAIALGLPQAPIPSGKDGVRPSGFLLAGEELAGTAHWSGGALDLILFDAVVTLRDVSGQPLPGWTARRVNDAAKNVQEHSDGVGLDVIMRLEGAFDARLAGAILGGAAGPASDIALSVARADEDRFAETIALLEETGEALGAGGETFSREEGPLAILQRMSGLLNGALLVVGGDGTSPVAEPLRSRWGDREFAVGAFNIVRGDDLAVAWAEGEMRLDGEPSVALGREGFAVEPPLRLGVFPLVSLVLWALAIAAMVWWIIGRPPPSKTDAKYRAISFAVYVVVLLVTLILWDRSFTQTFGTGVGALAREQGVSAATLPQLGVLAAVELIPWGTAALLFALPVRIGLGIALRHAGKGKSFKGLAGAGGLIALAIFGPIYALWCFNLVWSRMGALAP